MPYVIIGAALGIIGFLAGFTTAFLAARAGQQKAERRHDAKLATVHRINMDLVEQNRRLLEARPAIVINGKTFVDHYLTQGVHSLN